MDNMQYLLFPIDYNDDEFNALLGLRFNYDEL